MEIRAFIVLIVGLLLSGSPRAHQQQESNTLMRFNARSGNIEIAHRFYAHDAEHAVKRIIGKEADLLKSAQTREQFSRYVGSRFGLQDASGKEIDIKPVGEEVEGKFIWVYQEVPGLDLSDLAQVRVQFFYDLWPGYRNIVDVEHDKRFKSLRLGKTDGWTPLPDALDK